MYQFRIDYNWSVESRFNGLEIDKYDDLNQSKGGPTGVAVYEAKKATSSKDKPMKLSEPMNEKWDYSL